MLGLTSLEVNNSVFNRTKKVMILMYIRDRYTQSTKISDGVRITWSMTKARKKTRRFNENITTNWSVIRRRIWFSWITTKCLWN